MVNPVTMEIPLSELEDVKELVHKALTPSVEFSKDMNLMTERRDEKREKELYRILGWIQQKI